jgi:Protein of unknown function (DUF664)
MEPEAATLLEFLDAQRESVFAIVAGLSDEALRRAVFPSGWTCLGLIQHLALDDERYWFRRIAAGEAIDLPSDEADGSAWIVDRDVSAEAVFTLYRDEIGRANAIIGGVPLESPPRGQHLHFSSSWPAPDGVVPNLRWIVVHMIEETARHAGHLDAARELLDGRTGLG